MEQKKQSAAVLFDNDRFLAQVEQEIRQNGYLCDLPDFDEIPLEHGGETLPIEPFSLDILEEELAGLHASEKIAAFRPLPDKGIKRFVKRLLRKLMKFYVEPIAQDVTNYQCSNTLAVAQLRNYIVEQKKNERRLTELERENQNLKKQLRELCARLEVKS